MKSERVTLIKVSSVSIEHVQGMRYVQHYTNEMRNLVVNRPDGEPEMLVSVQSDDLPIEEIRWIKRPLDGLTDQTERALMAATPEVMRLLDNYDMAKMNELGVYKARCVKYENKVIEFSKRIADFKKLPLLKRLQAAWSKTI